MISCASAMAMADPELAQLLVSESFPTPQWLQDTGCALSLPLGGRPLSVRISTISGVACLSKPWAPARASQISSLPWQSGSG